MRIVIDIQGAQSESRFRGIGRYSTSLGQAIARRALDHEVWLLANAAAQEGLGDIERAFEGLLPPERICLFDSPQPVGWNVPGNAWRRTAAECMRESMLADLQPDVVHVSSLFEGSADRIVTSIGRLASRVPTAVTLYDLIPLLNPDKYLGLGWARDWYMDKVASLRKADLMLAISEHARKEAIEALELDGSRVVNISSAVSDAFAPKTLTSADRALLAAKFGIRQPFVMFTGAMDARKNVEGLLEAFALVAGGVAKKHRLVISGRVEPSHQQRLSAVAAEAGFADRLSFTGYVTDEELATLYAACDLFVFPSLHEGFGLPALEAMSCGTPTIGSCTTSIPEVIGMEDALFDPTDPAAMASVMARVLGDAGFAERLRVHALRRAALFSWEACAQRAIAAYEQLHARQGAARASGWHGWRARHEVEHRGLLSGIAEHCAGLDRPSESDLSFAARSIVANDVRAECIARLGPLPKSISWRIEGPFDSSYSLALLNRETALALDALGHNVVLHSTEGPGDFEPSAQFLAEHPRLAELHERCDGLPPCDADVTSRILYPPRVADMCARINMLHHYAWEESGFPYEWVEEFNGHLQGMTCLSRHVEKIMIDNGVSVPLSVSGCGVDHWEKILPDTTYRVETSGFRFLHVSSCFPRKGADVLLKAYGRAFSSDDDVVLVIKTFTNPHNRIHEWLAEARHGRADFPRVHIIEGDLDDRQLKSLYEQCHALVAPSRAEGYGLPMAEAMLSGLAVITTAWGGQTDFCNEETSWLVDYAFAPAVSHFELFGSVWAEPDEMDLARAMRDVYGATEQARRSRASRGRSLLLSASRWEDVAGRLVDAARVVAERTGPACARVGWISTWNTKCGIATYSNHLIGALPGGDVAVFAASSADRTGADGEGVVRCWDACDDDDLQRLAAAIDDSGVNALVVQFNYGFFGFGHFARFLEKQADAGRAIVVMMHATQDPVGKPDKQLARIVPALARCDRILVHSPADLNRLKGYGLVENVALFPHGILDVPAVPADHHGARFLVCSYGFFLPHKGLPQLVRAIAKLVDDGYDIHLRMVNAEYPISESRELVEETKALVASLRLRDRVSFLTEFLPDSESLAALADADLIVFPYQATGESASGAVRYGLASGRPVAVTPLPIFDDVRAAVHELPGCDVEDIAAGIARIIEDGTPIPAAERWRTEHRYSRLAPRLKAMLDQLFGRGRRRARTPSTVGQARARFEELQQSSRQST